MPAFPRPGRRRHRRARRAGRGGGLGRDGRHGGAGAGARFEDAGAAAIVHTDIARDGALEGVAATRRPATFAGPLATPVIASGGVASHADLAALKAYEADGVCGVICGRALYDGRIDPAQALALLAA